MSRSSLLSRQWWVRLDPSHQVHREIRQIPPPLPPLLPSPRASPWSPRGDDSHPGDSTPLRCKAKRQYLLTLQVSRYCLLALQSRPLTAAPRGSPACRRFTPRSRSRTRGRPFSAWIAVRIRKGRAGFNQRVGSPSPGSVSGNHKSSCSPVFAGDLRTKRFFHTLTHVRRSHLVITSWSTRHYW